MAGLPSDALEVVAGMAPGARPCHEAAMIEVPVFVLPLLLLFGLCAGLWGYASARRRAFRDFVAAQQRQRLESVQ